MPPATQVRVVNLPIGGIYASRRPVAIRTVLGSCIAACLFDPEAGVGGMNHFLLPDGECATGFPWSRYGNHAMQLLLRRVLELHGSRQRLQAMLFGGAHVLATAQPPPSVAERNAGFARRYLEENRIPLVKSLVGGKNAIEVIFLPHSAQTFVRRLRLPMGPTVAAIEACCESQWDRKMAHRAGEGRRT